MSDIHIHPTSVIGPQVTIGQGATVGPNCIVQGRTSIGARTTLGAGVTVCGDAATNAGVRIGTGAEIAAGSVVVRDVPAHAKVQGNPGTVVDFRCVSTRATDMVGSIVAPAGSAVAGCSVEGVKVYRFPRITDSRGTLSFGEFDKHFPFVPQRYFFVYDVPAGELRGGHSRKTCGEMLFCIGGQISVYVDDGRAREEVVLDAPELGLYIPSRVWGWQYKHSAGSYLVVLASHYFDAADHISDYDEFLAAAGCQA